VKAANCQLQRFQLADHQKGTTPAQPSGQSGI
jgi:hypothetical protein